MELKHIEIENLKTTKLNVRKKGGKDIDNLVPSIKSLGIVQPLLVRPTRGGERDSATGKSKEREGYEIVAGQRRYHALLKLAEEQAVDPVPCIVMEDGDDAKAIEASLAENVARLPMDEIDQYKAFAALSRQGKTVEDIASDFGVTERLVKQRLAIANLIAPILTLYRKGEIRADTIRCLTLASKRQQKDWLALYNSEEDYAPLGRSLKDWLFGGAQIPVSNALFDVAAYDGAIISDLFGEEQYFSDSEKFWPLQSKAIALAKDEYLADGWQDVEVMQRGAYWAPWELRVAGKEDGGRVYIQIANNGEVSFHEGYLTEKEAAKLERQAASEDGAAEKPERPELTKAMQNYLGLHRHAAVRAELLCHPGIALRLAVANIVAGSSLWQCYAEPQKAASEAIAKSLGMNKAEMLFDTERRDVRKLLGLEESANTETLETLVPKATDYGRRVDFDEIFARLLKLDDKAVSRILTFVTAETLPAGSATVEVLGNRLKVDMGQVWEPDETFLDLLRDKEAINAMLKDIGGKQVADANITATAKVQKSIISQYLDGTRKPAKKDWQVRYMNFPLRGYTHRSQSGRGGIGAIDRYKAVKKLYA